MKALRKPLSLFMAMLMCLGIFAGTGTTAFAAGELFHKESKQKKETRSLPMGKKSRSAFAVYAALVLMLCCCTTTAFAASDPLTVINNLSDFIFGLIRAVGMILLGFGVVQIGLSLKSHDPSQRANGFLTLAGGVVITFAKEILTLITG